MKNAKNERRKEVSTPRVFNEKRQSMLLIESAKPSDIYLWCLCIVVMFIVLSVSVSLAIMY